MYDREYYENNGQRGDRPALGMYCRMFRRYLTHGVVLEYGAGEGYLVRRLARAFRTYAWEVSEHANQMIRRNSPDTTLLESDHDVEASFFDGIVSLHTLEHLPAPAAILDEFRRMLRAGGILFFVVPNLSGLGYRMKKQQWFGFRDDTHASLLPARDWVDMVEKSGFEIIRTSSDGFWDVPYLAFIPRFVQKVIFFPTCAVLLLLKRLIYPAWFGEDLILVARRK